MTFHAFFTPCFSLNFFVSYLIENMAPLDKFLGTTLRVSKLTISKTKTILWKLAAISVLSSSLRLGHRYCSDDISLRQNGFLEILDNVLVKNTKKLVIFSKFFMLRLQCAQPEVQQRKRELFLIVHNIHQGNIISFTRNDTWKLLTCQNY